MSIKLFLLLMLAAGLLPLSAEPSPYLEIHKSIPVESNGLEFIASTQAQWIGRNGFSCPLEIQLLITNRSAHDLIFPTFSTFRIELKDTSGKTVPGGGRRDGLLAPLPILIHPGDTYGLSRKTELWWKVKGGPSSVSAPDGKGGNLFFIRDSDDNHEGGFGSNPDGKSCGLLYWDGSGALVIYKQLMPGSYSLSFTIGTTEKKASTETKSLGGIPVWSGDIKTKEASFEIIEKAN